MKKYALVIFHDIFAGTNAFETLFIIPLETWKKVEREAKYLNNFPISVFTIPDDIKSVKCIHLKNIIKTLAPKVAEELNL